MCNTFCMKSYIDQEKANKNIERRNKKTFLKDISKQVGLSQPTISKFIRNGCIPFKNSIYDLDDSFFEKIDSPEKAYFLGWIASDGCLSKGSVTFCLNEKDEDVLFLLRSLIKSDKPIQKYKKAGYTSLYSHFSIRNKKIFNDLLQHGVHPQKTKTVFIPSQVINSSLFKYYLRGFFEGDGCIYECPNGQLEVSIVGQSFVMFEQIRDLIHKNTGITCQLKIKKYKLKNKEESQCMILKFSGKRQCLSFLQWLYSENEHLSLKRKINLFKKSLENYKTTQKKLTFPVLQLNEAGDIIARWPSITSVCDALKISPTTMSSLCKNNSPKLHRGFKWKFGDIEIYGKKLRSFYESHSALASS